MAFWGIEIQPGKPYVHQYDDARGRLHISQATLGSGSSTQKTVVQCNAGSKSPVLLCALLPEKIESCSLSLEFAEYEEVTFSVLGPRSVHLTGYYLGPVHDADESDDSDLYGEDIAETESDQSGEYDTEDEEYDEDFIDDDLEMYPPSPRPSSGVVIEEIVDDEKSVNGNVSQKRPKKKSSKDDSVESNIEEKQIVVRGTSSPVLESEDEDGFPIAIESKNQRLPDYMRNEESQKNDQEAKAADAQVTNLKRKSEAIEHDGDRNKRELDVEGDLSEHSDKKSSEKEGKLKKKKKQKAKDVKAPEPGNPSSVETPAKKGLDNSPSDITDACHEVELASADGNGEAKMKKEKGKKKKKKQINGADSGAEDSQPWQVTDGEKKPTEKIEEQTAKEQPSKSRTYANGLVVEELSMGKPDGKRASLGNKVSVRYIGKLKKNGEIFDSNISGKPFKFRLGIGQVIKGWDVGVEGMRTGDKRRLTIPPSMGYGSKGVGKIPPNSWLVFDVELVDVQ